MKHYYIIRTAMILLFVIGTSVHIMINLKNNDRSIDYFGVIAGTAFTLFPLYIIFLFFDHITSYQSPVFQILRLSVYLIAFALIVKFLYEVLFSIYMGEVGSLVLIIMLFDVFFLFGISVIEVIFLVVHKYFATPV